VDNTKKPPSVLSICTGYGGIEVGLARAIGNINVLAHVEIEAYAIANLVAKMETGQLVPAPVWTDLKTFPARCFSEGVDILTGGYPCQPFSAAGQRKGADDPRHLWPWIKEHIRVIRPGICFFENVEGHVSLGLREVLTDLAILGYRVESDSGEPTWGLFSAAECGAPHQRKRVFILAYRECAEWRPNIQGAYYQNRYDFGWAEKTDWVGVLYSELGNTQGHNQRRTSITAMHREGVAPGGPGGNVADAGVSELNRVSEPEERREDRSVGVAGIGVANSGKQGLPKSERQAVQSAWRWPERGATAKFCGSLWPARPGEPQHEWEESRVLADTERSSNRAQKKNKNKEQDAGRSSSGTCGQSKRKTEPGVGRTIDGSACGLDSATKSLDGGLSEDRKTMRNMRGNNYGATMPCREKKVLRRGMPTQGCGAEKHEPSQKILQGVWEGNHREKQNGCEVLQPKMYGERFFKKEPFETNCQEACYPPQGIENLRDVRIGCECPNAPSRYCEQAYGGASSVSALSCRFAYKIQDMGQNEGRIDRLRLLGNGVVPATAEKAFLTLMNRIENPHRERPQIEIQMELFPAASNYI